MAFSGACWWDQSAAEGATVQTLTIYKKHGVGRVTASIVSGLSDE